jgi:uncharacterized membrane protein
VSYADEPGELQRLREQVAALTQRVYRLEQLLTARGESRIVPVSEDRSTPEVAPLAERSSTAPSHETPPFTHEPATASAQPAPVSAQTLQSTASPASLDNSLESRIGGQWLNRIGIVAVLVGLSYFLKFAFDNDWIGPSTQVVIGIVAGLGILLWSERFRRKGYAGFAYSLKAIAFGALYLSLWASSQYYHLLLPWAAFGGMVMVTLTATALSLRQNSELLAAFAIVGGFLTPVLVSTGENHELALLAYVALLDLGTAWMVAVKRWPRMLLGSFAGTALLFAAWAETFYTEPQLDTTLAFTTFYFLLFAVAAFADKSRSAMSNLAIGIAVLNAAAYFSAAYLMLEQHYSLQLAGLALVVAVFYFGLARLLHRRGGRAAPLYGSVAVALGIGYLTAAIPIKLNSDWMVFAWLVEAGALFWAAHRSRSLLLRALGATAFVLGAARLLLDSDTPQPLILNPRFGLFLLAIAVLGSLAYYAAAEGGDDNRLWAAAAVLGLNLLAIFAMNCEIADYFRPTPGQRLSPIERQNLLTARAFTYSAVWMLYGGALILVGFWKRSAFLRWQAIVLLAITTAKVFFYDIATLERGYRIAAFIVLGAILLAVSFFYQRSRARLAQ